MGQHERIDPRRDRQTEYLFKLCKDLYTQGLHKAKGVSPENLAAFAAGHACGKLQMLAQSWAAFGFDEDLSEAFAQGVAQAAKDFTPAPWATGPFNHPRPFHPADFDVHP